MLGSACNGIARNAAVGHRRTITMNVFRIGLICILACLAAPAAAADQRPNIVLFLADDLGYGELGCYGNAAAITPHLDRFASQGLKLTDCHSASSVCSPPRGTTHATSANGT